MATEVGQDTLVFSGWITREELVGVEVRVLDVLSDKKSQGGHGGRGCTREWERRLP